MKLFDSKGNRLRCFNTVKPKMTNKGGRRWVTFLKKIDGELVDFWYEKSRGSKQMYFEMEGKWYKTVTEEVKNLKVLKSNRPKGETKQVE